MEQLNLKLTLNQNGSITASWSPIAGAVRYHAYMRIAGQSYAIYNETQLVSTSYTSRSNLEDNKQYEVVVIAYGSSAQLASDGKTILLPSGFYQNTPFAAPQNVRATADISSVTVSFDTVSRATSYDILFDGKVYNVTATSRVFTGLGAGTSHTYAVRARNASQTSAYSATYTVTTRTQNLTAPANISRQATATTVTISWSAVSGATGYDIQFNGTTYYVSGTSKTFTGLTANTAYSFRLRARNASQTSAYSAAYTVTTQAQSLTPPAGTTRQITDTTALIVWGRVNGATGYDIKFNGTVYSVNDIQKTFTGLTPNTVYTYAIRAKNGSAYSAYTAQMTATTAPKAPTAFATSTATTITFKWNQAEGATGYLIKCNNKVYSQEPGSKLTTTILGLTPNTNYNFQICARGVDGVGNYGSVGTIRTLDANLTVPKNITKTTTQTTARISWDAVSGASSYDVWFNGATYNVSGQVKNFTGLTAAKAYSFAVRARKGDSYGAYTPTMTVTTAPKAPSSVSATSQTTSVRLSWSGVSGATGYRVKFNNIGYDHDNTSDRTRTFSGLKPNTSYSYQVCSKSEDGEGNYSSLKSVKTRQQLAVPSNIRKTATETSATISWGAVSGATWYDIVFNGTTYNVSSGTSKTFSGLTAGKSYPFRITAKNAAVTGNSTSEMTVATAPTAPASIKTDAGSGSIAVSWDAVSGAAGYTVWCDNKTYETTGTSYTVTGLQPLTPYSCKVRSKSVDGAGAYGAARTVRTLARGLDTPTGITQSCTDTSVTVSWSPVSGAAGYNLLFDSRIYKVSGTSMEVTGLRAGTAYQYRVQSRTADGTAGPYSPERTVRTAPAAPSAFRVVTSEYSATIDWDLVSGAASYDLYLDGRYYRGDPPQKFISLSPNTSYTYQVRSNNADGSSAFCAVRNLKTTPHPPTRGITVSAARDSVTLSWNPVDGATSYDVLFGGNTYRVTSPNKTVTGLAPGTSYTYALRSNNADGSSSYNESKTVTTLHNPPAMPLNVSAVATQDSVTVKWGAVSGATGYTVLFDDKAYDETGTSRTFAGLNADTSHTYRVRAAGPGGNSEYTPSGTVRTLPAVPDVPTDVRANANPYEAVVRWNAVKGADSYDVLFNGILYNVTETSKLISGLTPSTSYTYQVRARNAAGTSAFSAAATVTTSVRPPSAPTNIKATATADSVTITWDAVSDATRYEVEFDGSKYTFTGTSAKFENLTPDTTYTFTVWARNAGGAATTGGRTIRTLQIAPPVPENLRATAEADSVTVFWDEAPRAEDYELLFDGRVYPATECSRQVEDLMPDTEYAFQVRAANEAGESPYSAVHTVRTLLETPRNIRARATARTVTVCFDPVEGADGYDISMNGQVYHTEEPCMVIGDLEPETQYSFCVLAKNAHVESRPSSQEQISTLRPGPEMPSDVTATASMDSVTVSFSPVPEARDYDIQFDDVTYPVAAGSAAKAPAYEMPLSRSGKRKTVPRTSGTDGRIYKTFAGLRPNTEHSYCARANNAEGSSPYTDKKHIKTGISKDSGLADGRNRSSYPDGRMSYMGNDPVNALTGAFLWSYTWLEEYGRDGLHFTTMYDSRREAGDGALGKKWTHSLGYTLSMDEEYAYFATPYDHVTAFVRDPETDSFRPAKRESSYEMEQGGDGCYTVRTGDGTAYIFDSGLCLNRIVENGLTAYSFRTDEEGQIVRMEGRHGAGLDLTYREGHIASVTDALGGSVSFSYEDGRLVSATNPDGREMRFSYDDLCNLLTITDFAGEVYLTNSYDALGRVTEQFTAGRGRSLASYDGENRVTVFTDEAGHVTRYFYDESGHVTDIERDGSHIRNGYNENGQLTEQQDALGNLTKMVYDNYGRMNEVIHPDGTRESVVYDERNQPVKVVDRDGTENLYSYDERGNLTRVRDERGNVCTYTYDEEDNLTAFTDKGGNVWTYDYDSAGHLEQARDPEGHIYRYAHDAIGRMTSYTSPAGKQVSLQYSAAGDLLRMEDADGAVLFTYDENGNRTGVTDRMGNRQRLEYNEMGLLKLATDYLGNEYTFAYDERGNLIAETDPLGYCVSHGYDARGNRISQTDPNGGVTEYDFDAANRLIRVKDAAGGTVRYTYDSMGQIRTVTDQLSHETAFTYDQAGRVLTETDPLEHSVSYTYDEAGNMLTRTDEDGVVTSYTYDADNRLLSIRTDMGTTSFTYDGLGRIISVTDADGHEESAAYDGDGNLTMVADKEGRQTCYVYDGMGRLTQETAPDGGKTLYSYDKNGNCVRTVDAEGHIFTYEYDANNRMVKVTDPLEAETSYAYDQRGQLIRVTDARGGITSYVYDGNGNLTRETNPLGGEKTYRYDSLNRMVGGTDQEGNSWSCAYDAAGNRTGYTDANGNRWTYTYDEGNRLVSITDQEEGSLCFTYTGAGKVRSVTDREGAVTSYQYDALGRLTQISDALGHSLAFVYDSVGRLISQTDANGNTTQYGYSPAGHLVSVTDPEENTTTYTYDAMGQVLTREDALGNRVSYTYDLLGQVTSMTDALGNKTAFTYTADGRVATVTDAEGNTTRYTYDACGNLIQTTDACGHVTDYQYDLQNNRIRECLSESGEQKCVTLYQYDRKGRMIKEISPLLEEKEYVYDGNDNLLSFRDEEQQETIVSYDLNNRPVSVTYGDGRTAALRYNKRGELVELQDWNGTASLERDSLGRLTRVTDHNGRTTGFTYDSAGNRTGIAYPDGSAAAFAYDRNNRLAKVTDGEEGSTQYSYDGAGNMIAMTQPGSAVSYTYNGNGQPVRAAYRFGDASCVEETFTYDALGRITGSQRTGRGAEPDGGKAAVLAGGAAPGVAGLIRTAAYTYDALGRLTSCRNGESVEAYTYDALGNRTSRSLDGIQRAACQYNAPGQLVSMVEDGITYSFGYDKRGNLTREYREEELIRQYTYDSAGRMSLGKNLESGGESAYAYNVLGMCVGNVQKRMGDHGPLTREMQYVPDYLSGTGNELMAYEIGAGSVKTVFGRGYERLSQKTAAGRTFFHSDIYGSPLFAMDGQGQMGQYVERGIWGDLKPGTEIPSDLEENLRFTSYRHDPVIGKYFAQARFYDSTQGRMLGKDPIKRGLNPYPYCDNDPVDYTDPTGEIPSIVVSALIGGAIGAVSGFVDSAISQVTGGQKFNLNGALGAAANGAVVGVARGALAGTGVGIPLAFATDFAAGTLGSALEQCISEGKVSAKKSVTRGLTNATSNMFYGTGRMKSIKEAFGRGFGAGAATSGINYISDAIGSRQGQKSRSKAGMAGVTDGLNAPVYGMFRNPRNNCGSESPFETGLGYSSAKGYRYKTPQTGNGNGSGKGFSLAGFVRETLIGGVTGGLGSAAFYGAGKGIEALKNSITPKAYMTGADGEHELASKYGGESQKIFHTSLGIRKVDQYAKRVAHESKVGYTSLSQSVRKQILKDVELVNEGSIKRAHWHFFRSGVTGRIGATPQLLRFLKENRIKYTIHR